MTDEYRDEELEKMFADQAAGGGDDEWVVDWSPEAGLLEVGEHDGVLADVKKGETSGYGGAEKKPAIIWSVTDTATGRSISKTVPMRGGNGIERLNIDFARAFGVEAVETERGYSLPGAKLRACVGMGCRFKVSHWGEPLRDSLDTILPAAVPEQLSLPDLPPES